MAASESKGRGGSSSRPAQAGGPARTGMLLCGVLSSLLYMAMLLFVPMGWDDYSSASQTVSELSAIGAPTRPLWRLLGLVWTLLYAMFGAGVWVSAGPGRTLRTVGGLIVASALIGIFWPPMHQRAILAAGGGTLTDTLHIVWTVVTGLLTMLAIGFGAASLGRRFRLYSLLTMAIVLASGAWTGTYASAINANLPTPGAGVWERINIVAWLVWVMVLAAVLRTYPVPLDVGRGSKRNRLSV